MVYIPNDEAARYENIKEILFYLCLVIKIGIGLISWFAKINY